ncbi:MAG: monooxygenase [Sphingobacteriia bacterium]|nr:monooxygenase [Sphingobacteriia bacterium]NCC38814.1 monooxygenase [Gammaproteobacteria bacterium]
MSTLLQIDFPYDGPWGETMTVAMRELAESIATTPGLLWKIWTESPEHGEAGGIYLFSDRASADDYLVMHTKRLRGFGVPYVNAKCFEVNLDLSRIDRAPLDVVVPS